MEKLDELKSMVECSIHIGYNEHKDYYASVDQHWFDPQGPAIPPEIVGETFNKEADDIWVLRIYPYTPMGFYEAISNDLDALLDWGIELLKFKEAKYSG